jgi:hypothetical protein
MKWLAYIIVALLCWPAQAGWKIEESEGMSSYSESHKVIAWSKEENTVAIRHGTSEHVTMINDETGETKEQKIEYIFIPLLDCKSQKQIKKFAIVTGDHFTPAHRKKAWQSAQKWLKNKGYTFVAGKGAKEVKIKTAKLGPAHKTKDDTDPAALIPLPDKIVPKTVKSAHLEFVVLPEFPVLRLVVYPADGSKPKVTTIIEDVRIASTIEPKVASFTYSPRARCLVLQTSGPGSYASSPSGIQLVPISKISKALAK